jgi:hypothetical protein
MDSYSKTARERAMKIQEVYTRAIGGGESARQTPNSRCPPSLVRSLRAATQSTDLASYERFFTPSGRASIAMSEACAAPVLLAVLIVEHRWHEPVFEAIAEAAGIGGKLLLWLV